MIPSRATALRLALALGSALGLGPAGAPGLPLEYWSDHFVVLAVDRTGAPLTFSLDFNRGTSAVPGREKVAEFVGHACERGRWFDLQSGEYLHPSGELGRLVGNGAARVHRSRNGKGWVLDYDSGRATFHAASDSETVLHVQRDDPEMTIRHSAAPGWLEYARDRIPCTIFREHLRWRGANPLVGKTPSTLYGHFTWMPLVTERGDWWLVIDDPGQDDPPDDAPDHNWAVYRSPTGVITPVPREEVALTPRWPVKLKEGRSAPRGWHLALPALGHDGTLLDRGHFLDRYGSGLYAVQGTMSVPGTGRQRAYGLVDLVQH